MTHGNRWNYGCNMAKYYKIAIMTHNGNVMHWLDFELIKVFQYTTCPGELWGVFARSVEGTLITRFMGPTWGPSGADRTQVGPMLALWTLLSGEYACENSSEKYIQNIFTAVMIMIQLPPRLYFHFILNTWSVMKSSSSHQLFQRRNAVIRYCLKVLIAKVALQ